MRTFDGKKVLMVQHRNWGIDIGHQLAVRLSQGGARLAAITGKKSSHKFHESQKVISYEYILNTDDILENPEHYLKGRRYSLAHIAESLGIDSVWPMIFGARLISRSYGEGYNFANVQTLSDDQIILYLQATYACIQDLCEQFDPEVVVLSRIAEPPILMLYYLLRKKGVRCLYITDIKVRGMWIAAYDPVESEGPFFDHLKKLNAGMNSTSLDIARQYILEFRKEFKQPTYMDKTSRDDSFPRFLRQQLGLVRRLAEWYTKPGEDCSEILGATPDCRSPRILIRDHFTKMWRTRLAKRYSYADIDSIDKFVYYPLQAEPELTLDVFAPHFTNQFELVRQVAMSLPGDYTLVVKDHPTMMGMRSYSDLESLARIPNVKLINPQVRNDILLKKASMVLSPNSTALVEAAFFNKPSLQFGDQGTTQMLPNVIRHTDMTTLSAVMREHLGCECVGPEYERRLENFIAAAFDVGHDIAYIEAWEHKGSVEVDRLWDMYRTEIIRALRLDGMSK